LLMIPQDSGYPDDPRLPELREHELLRLESYGQTGSENSNF
jgi:hypothetical protein